MSFFSRIVLPLQKALNVQRPVMRSFSSFLFRPILSTPSLLRSSSGNGSPLPSQMIVRFMNRNARKPKKANHGKRPCSHARRHEKKKPFYMKSSRFKPKLFGFY